MRFLFLTGSDCDTRLSDLREALIAYLDSASIKHSTASATGENRFAFADVPLKPQRRGKPVGRRLKGTLEHADPHVVVCLGNVGVDCATYPFLKKPVWRSTRIYALESTPEPEKLVLKIVPDEKFVRLGANPLKKLIAIFTAESLAAAGISSRHISVNDPTFEAIAAVGKQEDRLIGLFPKREGMITKCREARLAGELESLAEREVVFSQTIWIKGWIDWDEKQHTGLEIRSGYQSWKAELCEFRHDIHKRDLARTPTGFEAEIPTRALPTATTLEVWVTLRNGAKKRFLQRSVWINQPDSGLPATPLLSGEAGLTGDLLSGRLACLGSDIKWHSVYQAGSCIGFLKAQDPGSETFEIKVAPLEDSKALLHLYVALDGRGPQHWLSIDPATGLTAGFGPDASGEIHVAVCTDTFTPEWTDKGGARAPAWFLNGQVVAESRTAPTFDLAGLPGRAIIEAVDPTGCHRWQVWHHCREALYGPRLPLIVVPPAPPAETVLDAADTGASRRKVVVIRPAAAPTDELYILSPLQGLVEDGSIDLTIVDFLHQEPSEDLCAQLFSGDCFVIVSRYLSNDWLVALTRWRHRVNDVFYVMDDDLTMAEVDDGMPAGYRQRMVGTAHSDFQSLLHLSSRFVVTCPFLKDRFASDKTDLLEPPYISRCGDMGHLEDMSEIRIHYHGTNVHAKDLEAVASALVSVHDKYPHVSIAIYSGKSRSSLLLKRKRIRFVKEMPWEQYKREVAEVRAHVALAPMLDTPYNKGKSIIKIHDIARLGAVGLYSDRAPYDKHITHGETGFLLRNDPQMWRKTLEYLVENPAEIAKTAKAAQDHSLKIGRVEILQDYWRSNLFETQPDAGKLDA